MKNAVLIFYFIIGAVLMINVLTESRADGVICLSLTDELLYALVFLSLGMLIGGSLLGDRLPESASSTSEDLPEEMTPTETAEAYEQEAVRMRARARHMDTETEFKESQFKAALKDDELKEINDLLRKRKTPRGK